MATRKIFISYRRDDSAGYAQAIYGQLVQRFDRGRVFMDVDTIEPGVDFARVIEEAVSETGVLLALIGKRWAGTSSAGASRLDDPKDFVRIEISAALSRNLCVIPVLVDGAAMPSKEVLPTPLEALAGRHAIEISNTRYQFDLERLVTAVSRALGEPVQSKVEDRIIQPVRSRASFGTAFSWWLTKTKEHPVVAAGILLVLVLSGVSQLVLNFSEAIRIPTGSVLLESTRRQVTRPDEIAGIWHHDIYGDIQLKKAGDRITGGYAYPRQIGFIYGDLQGEREGRRLDVTWCQDTTKDVPCANRKWQGDGYFILSPDGDRLEGKWRYSGQQEWMGDWLFTRK